MELQAQRRAILRSKDKSEVIFSSIEMEKPTFGNQVTLHPVEKGQDVADHVRPESDEISLQGVIVGDDAGDKLAKLLQFRREGTILDYIGRNGVKSVVIKGLSTEHHVRIANGLYFTLTLIQVRTAESRTVQIKIPGAKPVSNTGTQQPAGQKSNPPGTKTYVISWGDTLTKLARRHNTSVAELMRINPQITDPNKIYAGRTMNVPA